MSHEIPGGPFKTTNEGIEKFTEETFGRIQEMLRRIYPENAENATHIFLDAVSQCEDLKDFEEKNSELAEELKKGLTYDVYLELFEIAMHLISNENLPRDDK